MYTDLTLVRNYLGRELTDEEQAMLGTVIPAIEMWIDAKLSTTFKEAAATSRFFDGGCSVIDIDPVTDVTAVESVDNYNTVTNIYTTDNYVLEPINETVKRQIRLRWASFPRGGANIKVTGKFTEYSSTDGVPADIQTLATRLATLMLASSENTGFVQRESIEGHSIEYQSSSQGTAILEKVAFNDPVVRSILDMREDLYLD